MIRKYQFGQEKIQSGEKKSTKKFVTGKRGDNRQLLRHQQQKKRKTIRKKNIKE